MTGPLTGKKLILGVCGSIAAYKAVEWLRRLRREGALVEVVMTRAAARFVAPLTFAALSGKQVHEDMFDRSQAESIPHISLARDCDLLLIAPATAQTIARLANGLADDLLSTVALATRAKVIVCPAMNSMMYGHPATQANLARIREYGYRVIDPDEGQMACGDEGPGRLPEWDMVRQEIVAALTPQDLAGQTIVITAGPTVEPIDPVRFISNHSTGKMGYALARTAKTRGARVILISGPASLAPPAGVTLVNIKTAIELHKAVMEHYSQASIIVKAAAVSDYRPEVVADKKIKKAGASMSMALARNPDILAELGSRKGKASTPMLVGFAAESHDHLAEGRRKLAEKNLDLIVINDITGPDTGFASDTNKVILIDKNGGQQDLPLLTKEETANRIWDRVLELAP